MSDVDANAGSLEVFDDSGSNEKVALSVFISYRSEPDAPLAMALKKLIEGAVDPTPNVFVAGGGGLRPSNLGFKRQLQRAARKANAFLAIISQSSKEREWIFFEAGAAWGRDRLSAPVLVGTVPEDLPSTIADYQAVKGLDKQDVQNLIQELANLCHGELRDHFSQRYQAYQRSISQYLEGAVDDGSGNTQNSNELQQAIRAANRGESDRANELFDTARDKANDVEARCVAEIVRIQTLREPNDVRDALARLPADLQQTTAFKYGMAQYVTRPSVKRALLLDAVERGSGRFKALAKFELAQQEFSLGKHESGLSYCLEIMDEKNHRELREQAAKEIVDNVRSLSDYERLMVYLASLSGENGSAFQTIADLAHEAGWNALCLYCSKRWDRFDRSGASANYLGIARANAGLPSLAYESYSHAASLGISVAKCNMAGLLQRGGANAASLEILTSHGGPFDSADAGLPYELRSELERGLQGERKKEEEMLERGEHQLNALWLIADTALPLRGTRSTNVSGNLIGSGVKINVNSNGVFVDAVLGPQELSPMAPFATTLYFQRSALHGTTVVCRGETSFIGLQFSDFAEGKGAEWLKWTCTAEVPLLGAPVDHSEQRQHEIAGQPSS